MDTDEKASLCIVACGAFSTMLHLRVLRDQLLYSQYYVTKSNYHCLLRVIIYKRCLTLAHLIVNGGPLKPIPVRLIS